MDKVRYSFTQNQGNYESVRVELESEFDPKVENVEDIYAATRDLVRAWAAREKPEEPNVTHSNGAAKPEVAEDTPVCERCNSPMRRKTTPTGEFWGCTKWLPQRQGCNYTINISG